MKKIYLYLDESGNFASDSSMHDNPSLVGGYMTFDEPMTNEQAKIICSGQYIHSYEMSIQDFANTALEMLDTMKSLGCVFVVFENGERLEIVDGDTTYLNIISEGVVQLMQLLKSRYGIVEYNLIIAQRVAVNRPEYKFRPEGYYIAWSEYEKRLQEKIIIGASKTTSNFNIKNWKIEFRDARVDYRLMLADVVCHSRFRINKKFNEEQILKLKKHFNEGLYFSVFPSELETNILKSLVKGNISDAIFELIISERKLVITKYIEEVVHALLPINEISREIQFKMLFNRIMNLLNVSNELDLIKSMIANFKEYFIVDESYKNLVPNNFKMDLSLLSLTIATHEGSINQANIEIDYCMALLPQLIKRWESIDYYFIFKIRYGIHLINSYDIETCILEMNKLEDIIDNTFTLFPLVDEFSNLCNEIKSDIKGKVLGNRLQARTNLIKSDISQYELAIIDSNNAIKEFFRVSDLKRQYQYRSRVEYEFGNYISAMKWLDKSLSLKNKDNFEVNLLREVSGNKIEVAYTLMHLSNIMLIAKDGNGDEFFRNIYTIWEKNNMNQYLKVNFDNNHPYEIIFWKVGKLEVLLGNRNAGFKKMDIAYEVCRKSTQNQTLRAIGLGILVDRVYLLSLDNQRNKRELNLAINKLYNDYVSFMNLDLPDTMREHFNKWKRQIYLCKNLDGQNLHIDFKALSDQIYY